ncbi:hypothetical protein PMAYCL1PPCAC_20803, partial [Pristionchus mayeri]
LDRIDPIEDQPSPVDPSIDRSGTAGSNGESMREARPEGDGPPEGTANKRVDMDMEEAIRHLQKAIREADEKEKKKKEEEMEKKRKEKEMNEVAKKSTLESPIEKVEAISKVSLRSEGAEGTEDIRPSITPVLSKREEASGRNGVSSGAKAGLAGRLLVSIGSEEDTQIEKMTSSASPAQPTVLPKRGKSGDWNRELRAKIGPAWRLMESGKTPRASTTSSTVLDVIVQDEGQSSPVIPSPQESGSSVAVPSTRGLDRIDPYEDQSSSLTLPVKSLGDRNHVNSIRSIFPDNRVPREEGSRISEFGPKTEKRLNWKQIKSVPKHNAPLPPPNPDVVVLDGGEEYGRAASRISGNANKDNYETAEMEVDQHSPVAASVDRYFGDRNHDNTTRVRMYASDRLVERARRMEYGRAHLRLLVDNTPIKRGTATPNGNPPTTPMSSNHSSRRPRRTAAPSSTLRYHPDSSLSAARLSHSSRRNPSGALGNAGRDEIIIVDDDSDSSVHIIEEDDEVVL